MQPNDNQPPQQPDPRRQVTPPVRDASQTHPAVVQMTREQINRIYAQSYAQSQEITESPEQEVHTQTSTSSSVDSSRQHHPGIDASQWDQYHSAWQNYYQKYYERYYVGAVHSANESFRQHAAALKNQLDASVAQNSRQAEAQSLSEEQAMHELHGEVVGKVKGVAGKVRKSRHFMPLLSAASVLLVFLFLQYNQFIFSYAQAYITPGNIDPQNIIVDPSESIKVSKNPRLIIPKFNIDVNVTYENTLGSTAKETNDLQMAAMTKGVAYFGAGGFSARPGEYGNFGIAGHSSSNFYDTGAAKFVFAPILKMKKGDIYYLHYKGIRYTYVVRTIKEVLPKDVGELDVGTDKKMSTLITCTPLGTAEKRLLVFGEQISPDPATSRKKQEKLPDQSGGFTGKTPSLLESLF